MNILPKKRWHVRTKDNVARVRRDQALAREEEDGKSQRLAMAEREYRTSFLRQRATTQREEEDIPAPLQATEEAQPQGHVNFFADLEEQERTFGANKEREKEKRLEKEAEERKIGLLKYLGEGSSEYMKETPWYQRVPDRQPVKQAPRESVPPPRTHAAAAACTSRSLRASHSKREKTESKERKKKRRRSSSSSCEEVPTKKSGDGNLTAPTSVEIEQLRAERLKREREERLKAEILLRRARGEKEESAKTDQQEEYQQKYSSQFNPDLARQNRVK